jgi:serine O-acetyltransferase
VNDQDPHVGARSDAPSEAALELSAAPMSFLALVRSDYEALLVERDEPRGLSMLMYLPRLLLNPSLQLAFLVRVAQKGPLLLVYLSRLIQIMVFKCEICEFRGEEGIEIGPAIGFPHPWCIIIGRGAKIGSGVTIYNNTGIGADRHLPHSGVIGGRAARLGDRSVVYAYCAIQGPFIVGHDAVVGIHVVLDEDVPPGALKSYRRMRLAGEWAGEGRARWRPARDGSGSS